SIIMLLSGSFDDGAERERLRIGTGSLHPHPIAPLDARCQPTLRRAWQRFTLLGRASLLEPCKRVREARLREQLEQRVLERFEGDEHQAQAFAHEQRMTCGFE